MSRTGSPSKVPARPQLLTIAGLVVGAVGIAILWAAGVKFPTPVPPGIVILAAGAVFLALSRWRWVPAVGAGLGLFVVTGFLISPTGIPNLIGQAGPAVAVGQAVQVVGVTTALIAGVVALVNNYRHRVPETVSPH